MPFTEENCDNFFSVSVPISYEYGTEPPKVYLYQILNCTNYMMSGYTFQGSKEYKKNPILSI